MLVKSVKEEKNKSGDGDNCVAVGIMLHCDRFNREILPHEMLLIKT